MLANARVRLGEAGLAEDEALAALSELSGVEAAAMSAWAQAGCAGDHPGPKTAARARANS
jgi:hypothetical protein